MSRTVQMQAFDGAFIKGLREGLGISQAKFAAMIGCHTHSVENWEYDHCRPSGAARKTIESIYRRWLRQQNQEKKDATYG